MISADTANDYPRLLLIDTSTSTLSMAVSAGERILRYRNRRLHKLLSANIVPEISRVLRAAGLDLPSVDGLVVGLGPGSFTSLRVGLATVKGLAFALQKPVIGIPSPDALAAAAPAIHAEYACVLQDARRELFYYVLYRYDCGTIKRCGEYRLSPLSDILPDVPDRTVFIGDGVDMALESLRSEARRSDRTWIFAPQREGHPQARFFLSQALSRFVQQDLDHLDTLVPLYLYPEDCQVRR